MIDALISGKLYGTPEQCTSKSNKPYVRAKVACPDGKGGACLFVRVTAFSESVCDHLMRLKDFDSVAMTGKLTPTAWTDRQGKLHAGLDMLAREVMSAGPVGQLHGSSERHAASGTRQRQAMIDTVNDGGEAIKPA